jgi:prolipoprotein diacylglyceryltransferase
MNGDPEWFAPKRYGIGPGLPISWQGWAVSIGFLAAICALVFMFAHRRFQLIAAVVPITTAFLVISARTTRGGWRWRWGEED